MSTDNSETETDDESNGLEPCPYCGKAFDHENQQVRDNHVESCEPDEENQQAGEQGSITPGSHPSEPFEVIVPAGPLYEFTQLNTNLVDELKLDVTEDHFYARAVDPANVGMVEATLADWAFESYTVPQDTITIGLDLNRFHDVIRHADADQSISIEYDPEVQNLIITYEGNEFTLALIDPDSIRKRPDLPDLDLPVEFTLPAHAIKQALQFADMVSDHIAIRAEDETASMVAEGDTDSYTGEFTDQADFTSVGYGNSLYSLDYLKDMFKSLNKTDDRDVTITLGEEFPLRIRFDILDQDEQVGRCEYMLAPRIQSD